MTELEELIQQKKEIESRIKELKNKHLQYGRVKISAEIVSMDSYYLAIKCATSNGVKSSYHKMFCAYGKKNVVDEIPKIINDLENLYKLAKEE